MFSFPISLVLLQQSWTVPVLASVLLQKEFQEQKHIHLWGFF